MRTAVYVTAVGATAYRPVIIMHGLTQLPEDMEKLKEMITNAHPGTPVHVVDAFNGVVRTVTPSNKS